MVKIKRNQQKTWLSRGNKAYPRKVKQKRKLNKPPAEKKLIFNASFLFILEKNYLKKNY